MSYVGMHGQKGGDNRLEKFPNPFATFSRTMYPKTVQDVFNWSEYLWNHFGLYTQAIKKSVRYFLTEIEVFGDKDAQVDYDTRSKYEEFLKEGYDILGVMAAIGDDYVGFGNSFTSVYQSFSRNLICPHCGAHQPLDEVDYEFTDLEFRAPCGGCKKKDVVMIRSDAPLKGEDDKLGVIRWDPKDVVIDHCPLSNVSEYYLRIPEEWKRKIKNGDRLFLRETPWELLECAVKDQLFHFDKEYFKHIKTEAPAAQNMKLGGWGLPMFMCEFEQVVYIQILDRFNEAIALDYLMPFRTITPPKQTGQGDPMRAANMGAFMNNVRKMIKEHRLDPTTWHTLPFPVEYQALSGEGRQMAPVELLDRALDTLLSSMGIPREFYHGDMAQMVANPIALRMFEKLWGHYTNSLNEWLRWFLDKCSNLMTWERVTGRLIPTSVHEDDMIRQLKLDLAAAGQISKHTAFRTVNIDPDYERERMLEEQEQDAKAGERQQERAERAGMLKEQLRTPPPMTAETQQMMAQQGGAPPGPGGAPPGGAPPMGGGMGGGAGGQQFTKIDDLMARADQMAQEIIQMEGTARRSTLRQLSQENEALHAMVSQKIDKMENQAATQGKAMLRQGQM